MEASKNAKEKAWDRLNGLVVKSLQEIAYRNDPGTWRKIFRDWFEAGWRDRGNQWVSVDERTNRERLAHLELLISRIAFELAVEPKQSAIEAEIDTLKRIRFEQEQNRHQLHQGLQFELEQIYANEENVEISSFWDGGWTVKFGDPTTGYHETETGFDTLDQVADFLRESRTATAQAATVAKEGA